MSDMVVDYDTQAGATYVELRDYDEARVDHTVEVIRGLVTVDVDSSGAPIGLELLRAPAEIDEAALRPLVERFPALDLAALRAALAGDASQQPDP
jgi:uncharacterized protein YuzE